MVGVFLALSCFEAAPRHTGMQLAGFVAVVHGHPVMAIAISALAACALLAIHVSRNGTTQPAPAVIMYVAGVVASSVGGGFDEVHPTAELVASLATVARMLGPVLALRALLRYLSPPEQPAALRFVLVPFRG
jgi:hypothetical protein